MNLYEQLELAQNVRFWTNAITLGVMRFAIVAACIKYIFS